jgi:hypothetical protein
MGRTGRWTKVTGTGSLESVLTDSFGRLWHDKKCRKTRFFAEFQRFCAEKCRKVTDFAAHVSPVIRPI